MKKNKWQASKSLDYKSIFIMIACGIIAAAVVFAFTRIVGSSDEISADTSIGFSEVMSGNTSFLPAEDGGYYDWVELYNQSNAPMSLAGWKLGNQIDLRGAYTLPDITLDSGERILLYCTDKVHGTLNTTGFSLPSTASSLFLLDPSGNISASLEIPSMKKSESYALCDDAVWRITDKPTPGLENSAEAYELLTAFPGESGSVCLNELMAANASILADKDGDFSDWIELYNRSPEPVRLKGWALSDTMTDRRKWVLPDVTIDAGGYLLVYASAKESSAEQLHASFKLPSEGGTVYLFDASGNAVSRIAYDAIDKDTSVSRASDGTLNTVISPSPLFPNTENGSLQALGTSYRSLSSNPEGLYINEILCSMSGYSDWVELYNSSSVSIDLSGWWLSDDKNDPRGWQFPSGTQINAGEFLLIFMNGDQPQQKYQSGYLIADFALSLNKNESITLSRPDCSIADSVLLRRQMRNISYGRANGYNEYRCFSDVTPDAANANSSYAGCAPDVEFSQCGGRMVQDSVTLSLKCEDGLTIFYTTDGSEPTSVSNVYIAPITLTENTTVKAIALSNDYLASSVTANTYIFGDSGTLRTVCISGNRDELTSSGGVLSTGKKTAVGVYVEIYDYDNTPMISQSCELKLSGKASRLQFDQKSFRLTAKSQYGDSKFRAPLFTNRDYTEYNSIVMRMSGQDCLQTHMRDSILASLCADTELYYQETELCAVYVNGTYWGMYNMRERVDSDSLCQFEGWDGDEDVLDILEGKGMARVQGSNDSFKEMMSFVKSHSLTSDENLATLRTYCDIENYLDYVIMQIYTANQDCANIRVYRDSSKDGLWRWITYDLDLSYQIDQNSFSMWLSSSGEAGTVTSQYTLLFRKLMENDSMRDYFLTRFGQLLATTLSADNVVGKIETRYSQISSEMERNCARWGWSTSTWTKYLKKMAKYATNRPGKLIEYAQVSFKLSDAEVQHYFGDALAIINASQAA